MLQIASTPNPSPLRAGLSRTRVAFPAPVVVRIESPTGGRDHLTITGPHDGLKALENGLGCSSHVSWHTVAERLTATSLDPAPEALERARHTLAVYAAQLGVLEW